MEKTTKITDTASVKKKRSKVVGYNKWGYIFLIPFVVVFLWFQLVPLFRTIYNSFFEYYRVGLKFTGPTFIGLENYKTLLKDSDILQYFKNTLIMWLMCFIPQILVSLLLAAWFSDPSLRLKGTKFFKTVIYLPNLIMASAFALMFYAFFSKTGPVNNIYMSLSGSSQPFEFLDHIWSSRSLVAGMNFLMWFGNTTIILMAGMMGIDTSLYEAAQVDGATSGKIFFKITLPLLRPIVLYTMITSLIGGLQMYDVPQILTDGRGNPTIGTKTYTMTLIMYLNKYISVSKDYGKAGALSVLIFILTGALSFVVFKVSTRKED